MKFNKGFLQDVVYGDEGEIIENKIVDASRWSIHYRMVFKHDNKFYETFYSTGATETQDERPYEYEADEIECHEVFSVEKTITVYEKRRINSE